MDRLLDLLKREPVRAYLYSLAVVVIGYLVASGRISANVQDFALAILPVVLGVEVTRRKVTPARRPHEDSNAKPRHLR